MRTLDPNVSNELARAVTRPFYLLELGFPTVTLRFSTGPQLTWGSVSWHTDSGAQVERLESGRGEPRASISLRNTDNGASALVLGGDLHRTTAVIWVAYEGLDPGQYPPVELFRGVVDATDELTAARVVLRLAPGEGANLAPRLYFAPPVFNWLPPSGTVVKVGQDTYRLEVRR